MPKERKRQGRKKGKGITDSRKKTVKTKEEHIDDHAMATLDTISYVKETLNHEQRAFISEHLKEKRIKKREIASGKRLAVGMKGLNEKIIKKHENDLEKFEVVRKKLHELRDWISNPGDKLHTLTDEDIREVLALYHDNEAFYIRIKDFSNSDILGLLRFTEDGSQTFLQKLLQEEKAETIKILRCLMPYHEWVHHVFFFEMPEILDREKTEKEVYTLLFGKNAQPFIEALPRSMLSDLYFVAQLNSTLKVRNIHAITWRLHSEKLEHPEKADMIKLLIQADPHSALHRYCGLTETLATLHHRIYTRLSLRFSSAYSPLLRTLPAPLCELPEEHAWEITTLKYDRVEDLYQNMMVFALKSLFSKGHAGLRAHDTDIDGLLESFIAHWDIIGILCLFEATPQESTLIICEKLLLLFSSTESVEEKAHLLTVMLHFLPKEYHKSLYDLCLSFYKHADAFDLYHFIAFRQPDEDFKDLQYACFGALSSQVFAILAEHPEAAYAIMAPHFNSHERLFWALFEGVSESTRHSLCKMSWGERYHQPLFASLACEDRMRAVEHLFSLKMPIPLCVTVFDASYSEGEQNLLAEALLRALKKDLGHQLEWCVEDSVLPLLKFLLPAQVAVLYPCIPLSLWKTACARTDKSRLYEIFTLLWSQHNTMHIQSILACLSDNERLALFEDFHKKVGSPDLPPSVAASATSSDDEANSAVLVMIWDALGLEQQKTLLASPHHFGISSFAACPDISGVSTPMPLGDGMLLLSGQKAGLDVEDSELIKQLMSERGGLRP